MDIRDILKSFDQLTEGDSTVHKAGPGGYGNRHGTDDVTDQYGKPIGRMSLGKLGAQNEPKRGKGRPPNPDKAQSYDSSALSKAMGMGKAPKPTGKPSVKHSLKEYFNELDDALNEAGLAVQPMPVTPQQKQQQAVASKPSFMIKDPANPTTPAITTSDPAVVNAAKNGTMTMQKPGASPTSAGATPATGSGSQIAPMEEEGGNWIKGAIKHPGAFTKKAKSHGMTPSQFRDKVLAHKEDYPAKTEKQAQLAKTLSKMHESQGESPYTLELISSEEQDDPEGWSTMNVSTFKVLKNGKEIGTAEYDDYFGNLDIDINGKRQQLKYDSNHPLLKMAKHAVEEPINIAQHGVKEAEAPQHFAQSSPISTGGRNPNSLEEGKKTVKKDDRAEKDGKKVTKDLEYDMGHKGKDDAKAEKAGKKVTKDIEYDDKKKKIKEAAKPDFLDLDKDGNKKEPMKNASIDSKRKNQVAAAGKAFNDADEYKKSGGSSKKKVKEGMEHNLQAARLEGKSHALRKMPYNCTHDDMEEARHYHDGFKEGLDECYGQMPIMGRTAVGEVSPTVGTMASYGADDMGMDEGNAFTAGLAKTPQGGKFKVGGSTFTDRTSYDSPLDEFAFESFDKQLNALLESEEKVSEGMTVSISKGQQGSPDSVSVSAQDGEADQLLSIIKSAGLGLFGGEEKGFNAPEGSAGAHGGISVVDDHDGMMALMKRLSGGEMAADDGQEGEEEHSHEGEEETCNECGGMMEENHQCDSGEQSVMGEDESEDQMAYEVAEANAPDSGADNTNADVAGNAAANSALATADAGADEEEGQVYSSTTESHYKDPDGDEDSAADKADQADHERRGQEEDDKEDFFHNPRVPADKQLKAPPKEVNVQEAFANLYKKLAYLSEESTSEKDAKAEKAGKKVAKDIEYDEDHKGKDDNKAERAGKKVTKDIEYDDKKDKKVDESYANSADDTFEADIDFMTRIISGGLNKQKSSGQTTIPVISGQKSRMGVDGLGSPMKESTDLLKDYMKLSGL